jgi:hypothetical protein
MIISKDKGEVYNWVINSLDEDLTGLPNDLTIGIFGCNMLLAGVIYTNVDNICYLTINAVSPKWCTRENLSKIFNIPFEAFGSKIVKCATSSKNKRVNKLLTGLKLREEGHLRCSRPDGSDEKVFSITQKELKRKEWYRDEWSS